MEQWEGNQLFGKDTSFEMFLSFFNSQFQFICFLSQEELDTKQSNLRFVCCSNIH
jgi:hypothetical protein